MKQDKNFTVRLKATIERKLKQAGVIQFGLFPVEEWHSKEKKQLWNFIESLNDVKLEDLQGESLPGKEEGYINGLKELLRMAGCPELLIENPNMLKGQVEAVDHEWALKAIEKYKDRPYIDTNAEGQ